MIESNYTHTHKKKKKTPGCASRDAFTFPCIAPFARRLLVLFFIFFCARVLALVFFLVLEQGARPRVNSCPTERESGPFERALKHTSTHDELSRNA